MTRTTTAGHHHEPIPSGPDGFTPHRPDRHTPYSDPGSWAGLLAAVPPEPAAIGAVARNMIVHYRSTDVALPAATRGQIHHRWLQRTLATDQGRHGTPLDQPRSPQERVQGCCRDHSLLACAILRQHGIAARGRLGFARYFDPTFAHDHVIVEVWDRTQGRWVRFDPEIAEPLEGLATPLDVPTGPGSPFPTAAEVWQGWRSGDLDASTFGVAPETPLCGPWFIQNYVLRDLAHRQGDELLLWDFWGAMASPDEALSDEVLALTDEAAELTVAADAAHAANDPHDAGAASADTHPGTSTAEQDLARLYANRPGLRPGATVLRNDPFAPQAPPVAEELVAPA